MSIVSLTIITAAFYGAYNFFIKLSSGSIHQVLGAVILQLVAALLGGGVLLYLFFTGAVLPASGKGIWTAVLAGVFVGLAEIFSFVVFSRGLSASLGIPIIIGGTALFGVILGVLFLRETLSITQSFGVALLMIATVLLVWR